MDGAELCPYTNWAPSEPSANSRSCVRYQESSNKWEDTACQTNVSFVCEKAGKEIFNLIQFLVIVM